MYYKMFYWGVFISYTPSCSYTCKGKNSDGLKAINKEKNKLIINNR